MIRNFSIVVYQTSSGMLKFGIPFEAHLSNYFTFDVNALVLRVGARIIVQYQSNHMGLLCHFVLLKLPSNTLQSIQECGEMQRSFERFRTTIFFSTSNRWQ